MKAGVTRRDVMVARGIAMAADVLQWVAFPIFFSGVTGVADGVLDAVVCVALIRLVGWHMAFLPGFIGELLPFANVVPFWTASVFFATRNWKERQDASEALSPPPAAPEAVVVDPPALEPPAADPPGSDPR